MSIGAPNLIAGIGTLTVDGVQLALRANLTVSPDPVEREGIAGQDRVHGYREMPRVPFMEAEISLQQVQVVTDLVNNVVGDSTVVAMLADGRTFQLNQAWYRGATEIASQEGQYRARFEGFTCFEILATVAV
jgi:Phage tail tube protein